PVYRHALAPVGDRFLVLDLEDTAPLGEVPRTCIQAVDFGRGRWLATRGPEVQVYSLAGAKPPAPPPPEPAPLPKSLTALHPSPGFGRDQTLFAVGEGRIYRSRDGGETWERLRGGLPEGLAGPGLSVALALSPAFGGDGTVFAALREGDWLGLGIYRSTDGGDTWHPVWGGLRALRVERIVPSPQFPEDGRVAAYARYEQLGDPFEGGQVLYLSSDGGRTWEEVGRHAEGVAGARELPDLATLLPLAPPGPQFRVGLGAKAVERSTDGGTTWSTVVTVPEELGWVQGMVASPDMEADPAVFAFTSRRVLGSADGGATWQVAAEGALAPEEGASWWPVAAYIPAGQGGPRLLVAPGDGTLLRLDPWALEWEPLVGRTPTPSPPLAPTGTPTPCAVPVERFAAVYTRHQEALGCPLEAEQATWAAWQPFERGAMLWLEQTREIWVLEDDGHWERFADTWMEDQPESDPNLVPPPGLLQPIRGFGKVWRELLGGPAAAVGWALAPEEGRQTIWQPFQGGWVFEPEGIQPLVVFADGRWSQE
ncbi:MAG: exo-alpha-sialidase, partial [Anaerolineae bacterium]|nr:exo-alpha-sialidase [Anaerolineae bacterium]